jgi:hypothetical protein
MVHKLLNLKTRESLIIFKFDSMKHAPKGQI